MKKFSLLFVLCCTFIFSNSVLSQTKRYVKPVASGSGDGSSWSNASSDIQAMINASSPNDEVWVLKGTYKPASSVGYYNASMQPSTDPRHRSFVLKNGIKLYGGFSGTEVSLGQRKYGINKTIFSGDFNGNDVGFTNNSENAYHVLTIAGTFLAGVTIDGITFTGGNSTGMPVTYFDYPVGGMQQISGNGAGILGYYHDVTINNCIFTYNNSTGKGGGLALTATTGYIWNSLFLNNNAAVNGGAIYTGDNIDYCVNCTMYGNTSAGAIVFGENMFYQMQIHNSIIWGNTGSSMIEGSVLGFNSIIQGISSTLFNIYNLDPLFINPSDPDGSDNILGDTDDGLVPQCGPAIGAGLNQYGAITGPGGAAEFTVTSKDLKAGSRIQNGTVDLGAYETSLIQPITSLTIQMAGNAITSEDAHVAGFCNGRRATFWVTTGNGGAFEWKRNATVVSTSNVYSTLTLTNNDVISVKLTSPAGCGVANVVQASTDPLNVAAGTPPTPVKVFGPANPCPYINAGPVTYYINKVNYSQYYHWNTYNNPGITLTHVNPPGPTDTIVQLTFNSNFNSGQITVSGESNCAIGPPRTFMLAKANPSTAGSITGFTDPCPYMQSADNPSGSPVTYKINKVTGASSYIWTPPANATISSHPAGTGMNDTIVTVIFNSSFVSGSISVQAASFCGTGGVRYLSLSRKAAGTPGSITGPADACPFINGGPVNYTIKKVLYATSYTWAIPAGASATHPNGAGVNDTAIAVTYSGSFAGGAITVKANTNCNTSAARSLSVPFTLPSTPGTITAGTPTGCPQRRITYTIANIPSHATSVLWTVPASGVIISGQGTTSLVVEFAGATLSTDSIKVVGVNTCGISASQRKLKVGVLSSCRIAGRSNEADIPPAITKTATPVLNTNAELEITVMPNPSHQHFTLQLKSAGNTTMSMQVTDATGRAIESKQNIQANQTMVIGDAYKPGIYFATFIQGKNKKVLRLVKF